MVGHTTRFTNHPRTPPPIGDCICHVVTQVGSASAETCAIVRKSATSTGHLNNSHASNIQRKIKKKKIQAFVAKFPESVAGYTPVQVQRLYRTAWNRKRTGKQAVCP